LGGALVVLGVLISELKIKLPTKKSKEFENKKESVMLSFLSIIFSSIICRVDNTQLSALDHKMDGAMPSIPDKPQTF